MFLSKGYKGIYNLYFTNPATGKRTKVTTGKATIREANKFMDGFQIDTFRSLSKPTVANLIELREDVLEYAKYNLAPKTHEAYRGVSLK